MFCFCWALVLAIPSFSFSLFSPITINKDGAVDVHDDACDVLAAATAAGSGIGLAVFCKRPVFASLKEAEEPEGIYDTPNKSTNTGLSVKMVLDILQRHHGAAL